jgi:hypothetical protein
LRSFALLSIGRDCADVEEMDGVVEVQLRNKLPSTPDVPDLQHERPRPNFSRALSNDAPLEKAKKEAAATLNSV